MYDVDISRRRRLWAEDSGYISTYSKPPLDLYLGSSPCTQLLGLSPWHALLPKLVVSALVLTT